mgnify:FL=1
MEQKIEEVYQKRVAISAGYLIYQKQNNIERVKNIIPQIQEFVLWFLDGNRFGIEETLYQDMSNVLLHILEDILMALEQNDHVLMHDAIAYGLMEYLELFVQPEQEVEDDDAV